MSAIGRIRSLPPVAGLRVVCIGVRISVTSNAAPANDAAFVANDTSRPNTVATRPPSAAPMASMAPHSEPNRIAPFASSSSFRAMFGRPACAAGPTNDPSAEIAQRQTKPSQRVARLSTSNSPSAATACSADTFRMIVRRSNRSAAGPDTADIRNAGNAWAT